MLEVCAFFLYYKTCISILLRMYIQFLIIFLSNSGGLLDNMQKAMKVVILGTFALRRGLIIPLRGSKLAIVHLGKGIHDMSAQIHVHILGNKLPLSRPILTPVGVVTHHFRIPACKY